MLRSPRQPVTPANDAHRILAPPRDCGHGRAESLSLDHAPPLAAYSPPQALPSPPKTAALRFPSAASSTRKTAMPADHVPGKTRLCSYHSAAVRKLNRATSPALALSAHPSLHTDLSEQRRQDVVYLALTTQST